MYKQIFIPDEQNYLVSIPHIAKITVLPSFENIYYFCCE
jgi:hypothetical protein